MANIREHEDNRIANIELSDSRRRGNNSESPGFSNIQVKQLD